MRRSIIAVVMMDTRSIAWQKRHLLLKEAYTPLFGTVVFAGEQPSESDIPKTENWVSCLTGGDHRYACLASVMQVGEGRALYIVWHAH